MATAELIGEQRANGYQGRCRRCEAPVKPNEGVIYRGHRGESWATFCKDHAPVPLGASEARAAALERKRQTRTLEADGSLWTPREFSDVCKAFPGATWNKDRGCWVVSLDPSDLGRVIELCERHKISHPDSLRGRMEEEASGLEDDGPEIDPRVYPYQRDGIVYLRSKRRCILGDQMGTGKAQPLDAKILTPTGWRTMGDIREGDEVIGSNGKPTNVVGVYPQGMRPTYRVTFTDGSSTECDEEHLWYVETPMQRMQKKPGRVMPLGQIMALGPKSSNGNSKFFIPICQPVEFESPPLPIHPYALGYLLGNGCLRHGTITVSTAEPEIPTILDQLLSPLSVLARSRDNSGIEYRLISDETQQNLLTRAIKILGLHGLYSYEKFIPAEYLLADRRSREEILRGLMDSDGDIPEGSVPTFSTSSPRLAEDFRHLVMSLGGTCRITKKLAPSYTHKGEKRTGRDAYRMVACLPNDVKPFSLERKASRVTERTKYFPRRAIESIEYVGEKECQCIAVAADDSLYVTDDFIVTHNTIQALLALPLDARAVVVCPASLKLNWAKETRAWRPDLKPIIVGGKQRRPLVPAWGEILIVNYDVLPPETSYASLSEVEAESLSETVAVFDECQRMKNYKAARHKRGKALASSCGRSWLLTGTPIMNRPPDLKGILDAGGLFKSVFGSWGKFLECFHAHKNRWGGMEYGDPTPLVPELLRKVMLRRLTEDVLPDLPEKRYQPIPVELADEDDAERDRQLRDLSDDLDLAAETYRQRLDDGKLPPFEEFSGLRKKLADAKIPAMLEIVEQHEENDEPLIVFSAHRAPVEECAKRKGWAAIYGDTPKDDRQKIVERFQGGGLKGVALTIQAGGEGLTLTRARTCLFVDRDWTPALNSQAEARIRRIGSEKGHVTYLDLICDHVLERRVHELLTSKSAMHEAAIDSEMPTPFTINQLIPDVEAESDEAFAERMRRAAEGDAGREREKERKAAEKRERDLIADMERAGEEKEAARAKSRLILDREHAKARRGGITLPVLTRERCRAVREAMAYLASVCDHAETLDGRGFSKSDASLGHILAAAGLEDGTEAMEAAQHVCYRYRRQCGERWPILWETGDLAEIVADALDGTPSELVETPSGYLFGGMA